MKVDEEKKERQKINFLEENLVFGDQETSAKNPFSPTIFDTRLLRPLSSQFSTQFLVPAPAPRPALLAQNRNKVLRISHALAEYLH